MKKRFLSKKHWGLLAQYQRHLLCIAGLRPRTCQRYVACARNFLGAQHQGRFRLRQLRPTVLLEYLLRKRQRYGPCHWVGEASRLRRFFRFLVAAGHLLASQIPVIPAVSSRGHWPSMDPLHPKELHRFLMRFDRRTETGRRDYAVAMCLARLGLRISEVAQLQLADLRWREGILRLRCPKGGRERQLPLLPEVQAAMIGYLTRGRPATTLPQVFVQASGCQACSIAQRSQAIRLAFQRSGVVKSRMGPHLLRHTLATHLFQRGVSLKAVADLLGHGHLASTWRYVRLSPVQLRMVVQPWPKEGL
ncbi:MAG: tyrosine-type recombinase/integrase [Verrucomicrobiota bacterium]